MVTTDALTVAVVQMAMVPSRSENIERACELLQRAAGLGAQVVVLPELFESQYFPAAINDRHFGFATTAEENPAIAALSPVCRTCEVAAPVSFFERAGERYYNSVVMLDADGRCVGRYRKTHIPDGPGYEEKHYFAPGDTGFSVFTTRYGRIGVAICWDQWFPECARDMALQGAEVLVYPTAIGNEPERPERDTAAPWRRVMVGHAVANTTPVAAANRVGLEGKQCFYGSSFVCDGYGDVQAELGRDEEGVALYCFDRRAAAEERAWMGLLRDRRPGAYARLSSKS
ncbi:MAG: carbon-nitrogen hydrolase [Myxococcales bacterium]|nr:carbon-nitrogen hydrolase [Myxococcales bacterium]MDD9968463.1 carbon-nitrogen hydrolase [Myxococcales bacterium]